jgi:hypothetical protein
MRAEGLAEFRDLVDAAKRQGWEVTRTKSRHYRFTSPDKSVPHHVTGGTPGNAMRYVKRLIVELRRKGLKYP